MTSAPGSPAPGRLEPLPAVFRAEHGRVVATLTRVLGSLDLAEDAAQEAYAVAAAARTDGPPPNPGGWLVTTARRKALDRIRREGRRDAEQQEAAMLAGDLDPEGGGRTPYGDPSGPPSGVADDGLRLLFTCCDPALDPAAQVALTLKTLGGLSTGEVAAARIPYRVPADHELPGRLRGVLATVSLVDNEGYLPAGAGEDERALRPDLTGEAVRLARLLVELMPDEPECLGLLALLLLPEARRPARVRDGRLVTLAEQDRTRWDRDLVREGHALVRACLRRGRPGRYQLLAAVGAVHTDAATAADTDWRQVLALYDQLLVLEPTPVVALNRAVAVAEVDGARAGLDALDAVVGADRLERYHPWHVTRAELLRRAGDGSGAAAAYDRALALATNPAERAHLEHRRASL